jgi:hypothetical protein
MPDAGEDVGHLLGLVALFFLAGAAPEQRAVDYLVQEVPRWSRENHCFSCHNNGDAARALFAARQAGYQVPDGALADTTAWLLEPDRWDEVHGNPAHRAAGRRRRSENRCARQ